MNNLAGGNDFRIANTTHHPSSLRYQTSSWKNNSGGSSGASTGVSPNHSSNEDHNGEERLVYFVSTRGIRYSLNNINQYSV